MNLTGFSGRMVLCSLLRVVQSLMAPCQEKTKEVPAFRLLASPDLFCCLVIATTVGRTYVSWLSTQTLTVLSFLSKKDH